MDQHFRAIGVLGVILLGVLAILVAAFRCGDAATLMAYLGVASTAIGILGGLLNGNKSDQKGGTDEKKPDTPIVPVS